MNKFSGIRREVCSICWRHKRTHMHTRTPALLSRPPNFGGSGGRSGGAIQLRISVLQLNSAVPEQNERPKPSGEKMLTTLLYKVLLGMWRPCQRLPPSQSSAFLHARTRACLRSVD